MVWGAALRAVEWEREADLIGLPREEAAVVVSGAAAAVYPLVGFLVLLALFFFFSRLASVLAWPPFSVLPYAVLVRHCLLHGFWPRRGCPL